MKGNRSQIELLMTAEAGTHYFGPIRLLIDRMWAGVEAGPSWDLLTAPSEAYSDQLLHCVPKNM